MTQHFFSQQISSGFVNQMIDKLEKNIETEDNVDSHVEELNKIFKSSLEHSKSGSKKKKNTKKSPKKTWYDKSCYEVGKRLKLVAKLTMDSPGNPYLRGSLVKTRKEYKKLLKLKKKEWKNSMIQKLESIEEKDPKEYWKLINDLRENKKSGSTSEDAELFTDFFEKLYSKKNPEGHSLKEEFVKAKLEDFNFQKEVDFSIEELRKAIQMLKRNKSAGQDRIPAEILKSTPMKLLFVILKIMNKVKNTCQYPQKWAIGITSLLLKEGNSEDPNNYRAITVINCLAKVLAIMINERLEDWCQRCNIIRKEQIGFEKDSRPADHLFVLKTLIDSYNNKNKKIYACFVDFRKAFDSVWRTGLFYKLIKSNMSTNLIKLIQNMYEKTTNSLKMAWVDPFVPIGGYSKVAF